MTAWKLYYDDGSTFDSSDGGWLDAPMFGVIALAAADQYVGREIDTPRVPGSGDYYLWADGVSRPWWVDYGGLIDHLIRTGVLSFNQTLADVTPLQLDQAGVKLGRTVSNERFRELWPLIVADADETFGGLDGERIPPPHISG